MHRVTRALAIGVMWFLALGFVSQTASAEVVNTKPFAEKRIVLQISDNNPFKQTLVLNVANNLIKHYGPDKVEIEIVAFGPGLRLLFDGNANEGRIAALASQGVRFSACSNTVRNMGKKLEHEPALTEHSKTVSAGVVRILELEDAGYELIKP